MAYQKNRNPSERRHDSEVLAHGFRTYTSSDKCTSKDIISEGQEEGDVTTLNGATGLLDE